MPIRPLDHFNTTYAKKNNTFFCYIELPHIEVYRSIEGDDFAENLIEVFNSICDESIFYSFGMSDQPVVENLTVRTMTFYNSCILWSTINHVPGYVHLLETLETLCFRLLQASIPYRGCMLYDEFSADLDRSRFIGKAMVNGYLTTQSIVGHDVAIIGPACDMFDDDKMSFHYHELYPKSHFFYRDEEGKINLREGRTILPIAGDSTKRRAIGEFGKSDFPNILESSEELLNSLISNNYVETAQDFQYSLKAFRMKYNT